MGGENVSACRVARTYLWPMARIHEKLANTLAADMRNGAHSQATCQYQYLEVSPLRVILRPKLSTSCIVSVEGLPTAACRIPKECAIPLLLLLFSFTIFYDALVNSFDIGSIVFQREYCVK